MKTPVLTTIHSTLKADWLTLFAAYEGWYNTVSRWARAMLPEKGLVSNT